MFAQLIPQNARNSLDGGHCRKRQVLVPDLMEHERSRGLELFWLLEFKTPNHGSSMYMSHLQGRCEAVGRRAAALHVEYCEKASSIDARFCETVPNEVGPVQ